MQKYMNIFRNIWFSKIFGFLAEGKIIPKIIFTFLPKIFGFQDYDTDIDSEEEGNEQFEDYSTYEDQKNCWKRY